MTETALPEPSGTQPGRFAREEIWSQPSTWREVLARREEWADRLPRDGATVAVVGCGTSWFISQMYAAKRERMGRGRTDAFLASEFPLGRAYDVVIVISRSGTTTEVLRLLESLPAHQPTLAIVGNPEASLGDQRIVLDFADERSVVQTRYATATLTLLRDSIGDDMRPAIEQTERLLEIDDEGLSVDPTRNHLVFLGSGWTIGLAHEAALKVREMALALAESHPALDYRHGPIAAASVRTSVLLFGAAPPGLEHEIRATGAAFEQQPIDPMALLVRVQREGLIRAAWRGTDPDAPPYLSRSIVLTD